MKKNCAEKKRNGKGNRGLTLVELIVTIAIISIFSGVVLTTLHFGSNVFQSTSINAQNQMNAREVLTQLENIVIDANWSVYYGYCSETDGDVTIDSAITEDIGSTASSQDKAFSVCSVDTSVATETAENGTTTENKTCEGTYDLVVWDASEQKLYYTRTTGTVEIITPTPTPSAAPTGTASAETDDGTLLADAGEKDSENVGGTAMSAEDTKRTSDLTVLDDGKFQLAVSMTGLRALTAAAVRDGTAVSSDFSGGNTSEEDTVGEEELDSDNTAADFSNMSAVNAELEPVGTLTKEVDNQLLANNVTNFCVDLSRVGSEQVVTFEITMEIRGKKITAKNSVNMRNKIQVTEPDEVFAGQSKDMDASITITDYEKTMYAGAAQTLRESYTGDIDLTTITYKKESESTSGVADVSSVGKVTARAAGTVTVSVSAKTTYGTSVTSKPVTITIAAASTTPTPEISAEAAITPTPTSAAALTSTPTPTEKPALPVSEYMINITSMISKLTAGQDKETTLSADVYKITYNETSESKEKVESGQIKWECSPDDKGITIDSSGKLTVAEDGVTENFLLTVTAKYEIPDSNQSVSSDPLYISVFAKETKSYTKELKPGEQWELPVDGEDESSGSVSAISVRYSYDSGDVLKEESGCTGEFQLQRAENNRAAITCIMSQSTLTNINSIEIMATMDTYSYSWTIYPYKENVYMLKKDENGGYTDEYNTEPESMFVPAPSAAIRNAVLLSDGVTYQYKTGDEDEMKVYLRKSVMNTTGIGINAVIHDASSLNCWFMKYSGEYFAYENGGWYQKKDNTIEADVSGWDSYWNKEEYWQNWSVIS